MTAKLALGTVQFGTAYGIKNKSGLRIPEKDVSRILDRALLAGVDILDTSQAYGESEEILGRVLSDAASGFRVVSKFIAAPGMTPETALSGSLARLKLKKLHAFLYHRFSDFSDYHGWYEELRRLKTDGKVDKLGFSVYYPREIVALLDDGIEFDLVQIPYSIFDRRFEPLLPALQKVGVEVHVRSVFVQGLVFMDRAELPSGLSALGPKIERLKYLAGKAGIAVSALCLCFAMRAAGIQRVVIGVDGIADLENNLAGAAMSEETDKVIAELMELSEENENLLLPFKWKK